MTAKTKVKMKMKMTTLARAAKAAAEPILQMTRTTLVAMVVGSGGPEERVGLVAVRQAA
jgi:hypothetical protein